MGYWLLKNSRTAEAIEVFKLNAAKFPASPNVWDSLGEGYMAAHNHDEAVANYKKSLEINPKNTNAAEMLKKLAAPQ